jgi:hypothetical protein
MWMLLGLAESSQWQCFVGVRFLSVFLNTPLFNPLKSDYHMNRLCDYILTANEHIHFAMVIDQMGNIQCRKAIGLYQLPCEMAQKLADTIAILTTGILKNISQHHGSFQHITINHQNYTTIGQSIENGYLVYIIAEPIEPKIVKQIKETVEIYQKQEVF